MAIIPENEYENTEAADANYPLGSAKNRVGAPFNGTPLEKGWVNDLWGFLQKILTKAGITPSGTPDTVLASDYFNGITKIIGIRKASVAAMVADTTLILGARINTDAYYSTQAGGGSSYDIVAGSTGTPDGGSYIDLANGLQAKRVYNLAVDVRTFGAKFDGATDDTYAWNNAIDFLAPFYEGIVYGNGGETKIVGTITLKQGVLVLGADHQVSGINNAKRRPRITHAPTVAATDLFDLENTGDYVQGISVSGFSIYSATANSKNAFNLLKPLTTDVSNCDIIGFVDSFNIAGALNFTIKNTKISGFSNSGVKFNADTFVSTTTVLEQCHILSGPWGVITEEDSILDVTLRSCILESLSAGGMDIYRGVVANVYLDHCYAEAVPLTAVSAVPIIQIGVNGTSTAITKPNLFITGGTLEGTNGGHHADSSVINADYAGMISLVGVDMRRTGKLFVTTANTDYLSISGCTNFSVVNPLLGIFDLSHVIGNLPRIVSGGYGAPNWRVNSLTLQGSADPTKAWTLAPVFADTADDLIVKLGTTEKFRFNNEGWLSLGSGDPKANLDVTGKTVLGGIFVTAAALDPSQINFYISESTGNLIINAKKANGDLYSGSVALTLVP